LKAGWKLYFLVLLPCEAVNAAEFQNGELGRHNRFASKLAG
jgi:hypothetical protein